MFVGLTLQGPLTREAQLPKCSTHPEAGSRPGFGYAGGGFGPYSICVECDTVFAKRDVRDGNEKK